MPLSLLLALAPPTLAQDADAVLEEVAQAWSGDGNAIQQIRLTHTGTNGREKIREFQLYTRRDGDTVRIRGEITSPAGLAGTRFLTLHAREGAESSYLYLPALKQVQEIRSERRKSSLLGTDLALEDLLPPPIDQATHRIASEDETVWVIESTFDATAHAWSRARVTVHKDDRLPWRTELYDGTEVPAKVMEILEVETVGDRVLPVRIQVRSAGGSTTLLEVLESRIDLSEAEVPLSWFTPEALGVAALDDPAPPSQDADTAP